MEKLDDLTREEIDKEWETTEAKVSETTDKFVKLAYARGVLDGKEGHQNKAVIPQDVADWIEGYRRGGSVGNRSVGLILTTMFSDVFGVATNITHGEVDHEFSELRDWLRGSVNMANFVRAVLDGYEVEKEPLYYVIFLKSSDSKYAGCLYGRGFDNKSVGQYALSSDQVKFTESEIKEIDPKFWAFAVPVEEK